MPDDRPNILFFCSDQQRADLMGCMGDESMHTPNLDALAGRGALLRNCFVQSAVCMPSRSSIMTGRYPSRHGVVENGIELPGSERTLGHVFRDAGYHTGVVGRTHIRCSIPHPILPKQDYYGFTECRHTQCYWEGLDPHGEYLEWIRRRHPDRYDEAATPNLPLRDDAFCSSWWTLEDDKTMNAWVTDSALEILRRHRACTRENPFFLWCGTWDPHNRFLCPPPWDRMYPPEDIPLPNRREGELDDLPPHIRNRAMTAWSKSDTPFDDVVRNTLSLYRGMISHLDDQFGRLMRGLEELGMAENTIVVFTSDHGEMGGDHWLWAKGAFFFDDILRVPGIVAGPGIDRTDTSALVESIDLLPTLCDLAGVEQPDDIQGRSFRPLLQGETDAHREDVFTEFQPMNHHPDLNMASLRTDRYRVTCYEDRDFGELFDYETDPGMLHNRWDAPEYADARSEMTERLRNRLVKNQRRSTSAQIARW